MTNPWLPQGSSLSPVILNVYIYRVFFRLEIAPVGAILIILSRGFLQYAATGRAITGRVIVLVCYTYIAENIKTIFGYF